MYDLAVVGGGPGGLTAGMYAGRARLKTIVIDKGLYGGQMQNTLEIENYPGHRMVTGPQLSELMFEHMQGSAPNGSRPRLLAWSWINR